MPAIFAPATEEVDLVVARIVELHHPHLFEARVRIGTVFAYPRPNKDGIATGYAMEHKGRRILAKVRRHGEEERAAGSPDATITFDGDTWNANSKAGARGRARQHALADHELCHLVVKRHPASNRILLDNLNRPVLAMREHDWEITGFAEVAERHREDSYEVLEARHFRDRFGQLLFGFASDPATARPRDSDLARDAFAALLSVGHTEARAREAIDAALAEGRTFSSVADLVDAIYLRRREATDEFDREVLDQVAAEVNAGAMGPGVTAAVTKRARRKAEPAGARA